MGFLNKLSSAKMANKTADDGSKVEKNSKPNKSSKTDNSIINIPSNTKTRCKNTLKLVTRHLQSKQKKLQITGDDEDDDDTEKDSILEHRRRHKDEEVPEQDTDSILQHRKKFNDDIGVPSLNHQQQHHKQHWQQPNLPPQPSDVDQESVAMDLESLRRKPWYKGQTEQLLFEDQRFLNDNDGNGDDWVRNALGLGEQRSEKQESDWWLHTPATEQQSEEPDWLDSDHDDKPANAEPDWDDVISQKTDMIEVFVSQSEGETENDSEEQTVNDSEDDREERSQRSFTRENKTNSVSNTKQEETNTYDNQSTIHTNDEFTCTTDNRELLEYVKRSVERLERLKELREGRAQILKEKRERRQRRKERREQKEWAQKERERKDEKCRQLRRENQHKEIPAILFNTSKNTPVLIDLTKNQATTPINSTKPSENPILIDLIGICDRTNTAVCSKSHAGQKPVAKQLQSLTVQRWKSTLKEEIPVIVDLTNYGKPQQILDLTNISEPSLDIETQPVRMTPLPATNRRLKDLRRAREEKLRKMTLNINNVTAKKKDHAASYQRLMKGVAKNLKRTVCGSS